MKLFGYLSERPSQSLVGQNKQIYARLSACGLGSDSSSFSSSSSEFDTPTSKQELHRGARPRESVRASRRFRPH